MDGIAITCPNCSAVINVEKQLDFCFCTYCGTKVFIPQMNANNDNNINIVVNNEIKHGESAENFVYRARSFENEEDYDNAEIYYNRALDIDATNIEAQEGLKRIQSVVAYDNIFIERNDPYKFGEGKVILLINNEVRGKLAYNTRLSFIAPIGTHTIQFQRGIIKSKVFNIDIKNNKTLVKLIVTTSNNMFKIDADVIISKR